jgi:hypothetical protein
MAYKAIRDTFVLEAIEGTDQSIRRRVVAGTVLLPGFEPENEADVEEMNGQPEGTTQIGAAPFNVKAATVAEMREEAHRRGLEIEGGIDKARRATLIKALQGGGA